jgi:ComEC/Rec2-related protein
MQYLILALITVLGITISTLVTQSRWRGFVIRLVLWIIFVVIQIWHILALKNKKHQWKKLSIILWIRLLAWIITRTRLWSQDTHCSQTPDMIQWTATVDRARKTNESYLIQQWNYHWIYKTSELLQPWQQVILYAVTQKLQTCMTTYTHRDTGWKKLQTWISGWEFDYDRWLVMKWVDGYVQGKILEQDQDKEQENGLWQFKETIINQIAALFPKSRSTWRVAGTLIGSKDLINDSDYDLLINSWLVHLIVVSGGNLALIILILGFMLRWIPLIPRYLLIGVWLIIYVIIVWPDSSVLRALAMAIMTILWVLAGRKRSFGWMLSIATIILLRYNPMMIHDIWLRLSLSAVIGIYITYHEVSRLTQQRDSKRYKQWLRQVLLVISASIGAWLGTLPVLIWQFGSANLTSIIANSITGIIASITTIAELVTIALSNLLPTTIVKRWVRIVDQLVSLIYRIAKLTVERWVWIWAWDQSGFWIISWSIMIIFILLYRHTQKMRVEYLLETEE